MAEKDQTIVIKKIKKGGGGHHGGAWKVAYADFVTAMMAFFLLLWLLNTTTPEQKLGLADYFTPTIGIKDSKGIGFQGGKSPNKKGTSQNNLSAVGLVVGQVQQGPVAKEPTEAKDNEPDAESTSSSGKREAKSEGEEGEGEEDSEQFQLAADEIRQAMNNDPAVKEYKNNIQVEQTTEGMKINLIDDPKKEMFVAGGARLTEGGKKVLDSMANIVVKTPNQIAIIGHTDASGTPTNPSYTSWELSADRANASRRALVSTRVENERIARVIGMSDKELLLPDDPSNPRNRRITIVLLRGTYFRDPKLKVNDRAILSVPDATIKKKESVAEPQIIEEKDKEKKGPSIFDPENAGK